MEINKNILKVCTAMLVGGLVGGFVVKKRKKLEFVEDKFDNDYSE